MRNFFSSIIALAMNILAMSGHAEALPEHITRTSQHIASSGSNLTARVTQAFHRAISSSRKPLDLWAVVQIAMLCGLGGVFLRRLYGSKSSEAQSKESMASVSNRTMAVSGYGDAGQEGGSDPGLLKKHSEYKSYTTSRFTYDSLRVFFRRHPQADKLPTTPAPLPLLVFVHGLGGSVAQFSPLLTSLVNLSSSLAVDLPGCGLSSFSPTSWDAYKTDALVELLAIVIEDYREKDSGQGVVLIGHSMGCSLAAQLAARISAPSSSLAEHVVGLVAVCPKADPPTQAQSGDFRKLLAIPGPIFDLWRMWDRRGGTESASVKRFLGPDADVETKKLQVRYNKQSRTPVWRRMARGSLPAYEDGVASGGLPGKEVWSELNVPVFLIGGEADHITKAEEVARIAGFLQGSNTVSAESDSEPIVDAAAPVDTSLGNVSTRGVGLDSITKDHFENKLPEDAEAVHDDPSTPTEDQASIPNQPKHPKKVVKTTILPAPANHAMLYTPSTARTLAGLISEFLGTHVSPRLSLGWQLQFLSTAGKWDVKNLAKWQAVAPVSEPIAGIFRAMKTLREVDEVHCPEVFVKNWGDYVKDIIDISHEAPVYDPRGLEKGGVRYHKLPSVSKIPPTSVEVKDFIANVDRLRKEQVVRKEELGWDKDPFIGVHCHYGFNRTGYFIVCYLIERCGYGVQAALDEFATKRPKGIKHAHFKDQLFVRYCVGLNGESI